MPCPSKGHSRRQTGASAALLCAAMALGTCATAQSARPAEGPPSRRDAANPADPFSAPQLEPVRIYGEQVGERVYHREDIAATPSSNRDLSTLVSSHPAVRTNPGAASSQDRGSLDVEDISFHGASPYQNLFAIDGMDATNRVDPASKNLNLQIGNVPSNAQSYFIDTGLLDQVRVYDSFVPVEYGRFTGGVVDARLRRFSGENRLRFNYRWNTSNMTRQRVAQGKENDWAQGKPGYSPQWTKRFYSVVGDFALNDKSGVVMALSHRQSDISRWIMGADDKGERPLTNQNTFRDRIDNFLGKFSVRASADTDVDLTLKYSDRSARLASNLFRYTHWDNNHAAHGLDGKLDQRFQGGHYMLQAGWDHADSNRQSIDNVFVTHVVPGLPQYTTGGFGREQTQQDTWTLKGRVDLDPLQTGALTHTTYIGANLNQINAGFKRFRDSYSYRRAYAGDGNWRDCSKTHNLPGNVNVSYHMAGLYLSDRITWRRLALDAGLRYDQESFLRTRTLSPRTRLDWDVLGAGNTLLSAGWSRYYGAEVLETAIEAERHRLSRLEIDSKGKPVADGAKPYRVDYDGLRMPHDDEWAVSLRQRLAGLEGTLRYVHRNGRDQWTKQSTGARSYRYRNDGHSRTDSVTFTLGTLEPWRVGKTRWRLQASWGWQKRKTNNDLVKGYDGDARDPDERVIYDGAPMRAIDLPPTTFYQPQVATLNLVGAYPRLRITWSNALNWRSRRNATLYIGRGPKPDLLDSYKSGAMPSYWTWDTKLSWQPSAAPSLEFTIEVLNLLNRMPVRTASSPRGKTTPDTYQSGRELWLQVGYRF